MENIENKLLNFVKEHEDIARIIFLHGDEWAYFEYDNKPGVYFNHMGKRVIIHSHEIEKSFSRSQFLYSRNVIL